METPKHYHQILESLTISDVIKWVHSYNGDNTFICSCQRLMLSNRPLTPKQIVGLKKSCAYFMAVKPTAKTDKQKQKLQQYIDELVNS